MQYSILTVDDHNLNNRIIKSILESTYSIDCALDGSTTLQMVQEKKYDLVLLDIGLPDISGFEVAITLKKLQIPFIFVSASVTTEYITNGYKCGALDYIRKPINADELKFRIQSHLELLNVKNIYGQKIDKVKNDMLNIFSHEFNTPLNSILNFAEYIQRNISKELTPKKIEKLESLSSKIAQNGYILKDVHESLFQLSSIQSEKFIGNTKIDIDILLQTLQTEYESRFQKKLIIQNSVASVVANCELFKLLISNLLKFGFKRSEKKLILDIKKNESITNGIKITLLDDGKSIDKQEFKQARSLLDEDQSITQMEYKSFDHLEVLIINSLLEKYKHSFELQTLQGETNLTIELQVESIE